MNVNNCIGYSEQNVRMPRLSSEMTNFPHDALMQEVISHLPQETDKQILLNVYERYKREFDF